MDAIQCEALGLNPKEEGGGRGKGGERGGGWAW